MPAGPVNKSQLHEPVCASNVQMTRERRQDVARLQISTRKGADDASEMQTAWEAGPTRHPSWERQAWARFLLHPRTLPHILGDKVDKNQMYFLRKKKVTMALSVSKQMFASSMATHQMKALTVSSVIQHVVSLDTACRSAHLCACLCVCVMMCICRIMK